MTNSVRRDAILQLGDFSPEQLRMATKVSASKLTTFGMGGDFSCLLEPQSIEVLQELLVRLAAYNLPWKILGAGSNLLVSTSGVSHSTIKLGRSLGSWSFLASELSIPGLKEIYQQGVLQVDEFEDFPRVIAFGSTSLMALSRQLCARGLAGLEFAAGIPASVGGAVKMNAGAHGKDIASVLKNVIVVSAARGVEILPVAALNCGYRHTELAPDCVVVAAEFQLRREDIETVKKRRADALAYRKATQPLHLPSAGSVFKNPIGSQRAAAQLLEECGCKNLSKGAVEFSSMHANWLVRVGEDASVEDATFLIAQARKRVEDAYGIDLETEIISW